MENLDSLITFWNKWMMLPSFLIGFLGVIIFIFSKSELLNLNGLNKAGKIGIILISQLVLSWSIGFSLSAFFEYQVKAELTTFLNNPDLELKINGEKINTEDSIKIFEELKEIGNVFGHGSFPKKEKKFEIISKNEKMTLRIWQDSEIKNEFWIFSDKYKQTKLNSFGHFKIEILKRYYSG